MKGEPLWARRARAMFKAGLSTQQIAKVLKEEGVLRQTVNNHGPAATVWKGLHPELLHVWDWREMGPP